jgi:hypothetical protein
MVSKDPVRPGSRCDICRLVKGESKCQPIPF